MGRMVQQVLPKGVKRVRYYGVPATTTFAKLTRMMHAALAKVKGIVKGAIKLIAVQTSRARSQQRPGRAPWRCPHGHHEVGLGKIWHPEYGVLYDELGALKRGT